MKRVLLVFLVTLICALLIGCGSLGKNFDTSRVQDIKNNQTTKAEILDWFGLPFKEGIENNFVMWTYQYDQYIAGQTESKDLVILFDNNNHVKAYRYTSTDGE